MNAASKTPVEKTALMSSHQAQFVREHNNCTICETELEIHYDINMKDRTVQEEAYCSCCGIRARKNSHSLN